MNASPTEALAQLGELVAEAARAALTEVQPRTVAVEAVATLLDYDSVAEHVTPGRVVVTTSSVDGLAGRSLLLLSGTTAARIGGRELPDPPATAAGESAEDGAAPPEEPAPAADVVPSGEELEAVGQLGSSINDAVAEALSVLLGQTLHYEPPEASIIEDPRFIVRPGAVQAILASLTLDGESLRIIHFAPNSLVIRAGRAFEDLANDFGPLGDRGPSAEALSGMKLRVWAELGRTEIALSDALGLPAGAVVELDRAIDAPVDLYVNGVSFAAGRLVVTDEGEWALQVEEVRRAAGLEELLAAAGPAVPDAAA